MSDSAPRRRLKLKHISVMAIAVVVLSAIFIPFQHVEAFTLGVNIPNTVVRSTDGVDFSLSLNVQPGELIPIAGATILLDEGKSSQQSCNFDDQGHPISTCSMIDSLKIDVSPFKEKQQGYAYGYGKVSGGPIGSGYSITYSSIGNNVYSYVYSYGLTSYVYGYVGPVVITFSGKLHTIDLDLGTHTLQASVDTGASNTNSHLISDLATFTLTENPNPHVVVFVESKLLDGTPITGMHMNVAGPDVNIDGFTPATFSEEDGLVSGETYTIFASDFGSRVFDHWSDAGGNQLSTDRGYSFTTIHGTTHLVAVYHTSTTPPPTTLVTIKAVDEDNTPIEGVFNKINDFHGALVDLGNTHPDGTSNYQLEQGKTFRVMIANKETHIFHHWSDQGGNLLSNDRNYDFTTAGSEMTLKAVFKNVPGTHEIDVFVPAGDNVQVSVDLGGGHVLKLVFEHVTTGGIIRITTFTPEALANFLGDKVSLQSGEILIAIGGKDLHSVGNVFDLDLTGIGRSGGVQMTTDYDKNKVNGLDSSDSDTQFLHFVSSTQTWKAESTTVDSINGEVTTDISDFSMFAVGVPGGTRVPAPNSSGGGGGGGGGGGSPPPVVSEVGGVEEWKSFTITVDGQTYTIQYMITNGTVTNMTVDKASRTLSVLVNTTADGNLQLRLPRALIDSRTGTDGKSGDDLAFPVYVDNKLVDPKEAASSSTMRQISIDFTKGTQKIDIMGTFVVPEFGAIAAIVLAIAFVGIIVAAARYNNRFNFRSRL